MEWGKVMFSVVCVCQSVCLQWGSPMWPLIMTPWTSLYTPHPLDHLLTAAREHHLVVATETRTVCRGAERIRLEYFLVFNNLEATVTAPNLGSVYAHPHRNFWRFNACLFLVHLWCYTCCSYVTCCYMVWQTREGLPWGSNCWPLTYRTFLFSINKSLLLKCIFTRQIFHSMC